MLAGIVLAGTSFLIKHGATQYADVPLAFYFMATLVLFCIYRQVEDRKAFHPFACRLDVPVEQRGNEQIEAVRAERTSRLIAFGGTRSGRRRNRARLPGHTPGRSGSFRPVPGSRPRQGCRLLRSTRLFRSITRGARACCIIQLAGGDVHRRGIVRDIAYKAVGRKERFHGPGSVEEIEAAIGMEFLDAGQLCRKPGGDVFAINV